MDELIQALAVTAEITGTRLSEGAALVMSQDLAAYPTQQVLGALKKCRLELKGRLTVAEVIARLDDGRPGAEEAWAMLPFDESQTVVWTDEMARAWGVASPLMAHDRVAARMAFKQAYDRELSKSRGNHVQTKWTVSFGDDPHGRDGPLLDAAEKRRLPASHVAGLLGPTAASVTLERLKELAFENAPPRLKG